MPRSATPAINFSALSKSFSLAATSVMLEMFETRGAFSALVSGVAMAAGGRRATAQQMLDRGIKFFMFISIHIALLVKIKSHRNQEY